MRPTSREVLAQAHQALRTVTANVTGDASAKLPKSGSGLCHKASRNGQEYSVQSRVPRARMGLPALDLTPEEPRRPDSARTVTSVLARQLILSLTRQAADVLCRE